MSQTWGSSRLKFHRGQSCLNFLTRGYGDLLKPNIPPGWLPWQLEGLIEIYMYKKRKGFRMYDLIMTLFLLTAYLDLEKYFANREGPDQSANLQAEMVYRVSHNGQSLTTKYASGTGICLCSSYGYMITWLLITVFYTK